MSVLFASAGEWEQWLEHNHDQPDGVWIKIAKKGSGIESVRYPEVLDIALCFGWIDARREALDDQFFLQRFTPRRARSVWSLVNIARMRALLAAGRVTRAGGEAWKRRDPARSGVYSFERGAPAASHSSSRCSRRARRSIPSSARSRRAGR